VAADEFAEGEVFAFEEGGPGFGDGFDPSTEELDFTLESQSESAPIFVPSSYDDLMELWCRFYEAPFRPKF
jgi:hypothetical protein